MDQDQKIKEFFTRERDQEIQEEDNDQNNIGQDKDEQYKEEENYDNQSNQLKDQQEFFENQQDNDQNNQIQQNENMQYPQEDQQFDQEFQQEDQEFQQEDQEFQQDNQEFQQQKIIQQEKQITKDQDPTQSKPKTVKILQKPLQKIKTEKKSPPKIKPNLEEINKNLKEIQQKLNINLSKLMNPQTRVQAMKQLKDTIKENTNEYALKVYIQTICEKQKSDESGAQECEIMLIGYICQMYKSNLIDLQDKPPCLETTVLKIVESIHRYFTESSSSVKLACSKALIEVYVNCLSKIHIETIIMILFDPIFELLASGSDRVSQQTATICLSELISYMKKINQKLILQKIKKKIIIAFIKTNPEFFMIMDSLETCMSIFGFDFIKSKLKQILNKLILFIKKVQTGQQSESKVQVCRILQIIAAYQIDDNVLQDLEYQNIVEILKDLAKTEKNVQVQLASFEALRQWEKLILKEQAQLKESNVVNNHPLKAPCLNNFKSLREKFKQQKEMENQLKNKQNQVLKRTQETPEKVIDKKSLDDVNSKVFVKKGSGFGGGYYGTGIPKRQIDQMNFQSHEKKLKDLREMINKGIDRSLSNENQSDAQLVERQKKIDSNFIINRPKTAQQTNKTKEDNLVILNQKIKNNLIHIENEYDAGERARMLGHQAPAKQAKEQLDQKEQRMKEYKALQQELIQNYITQDEFEDSLQKQPINIQKDNQQDIQQNVRESLSQQFYENQGQSIKQSVLTIISEKQNESKNQSLDEQNLKKMIKEQFDELINQQQSQQLNPLQELIRKQIADQINQFLKQNQINLMIQQEQFQREEIDRREREEREQLKKIQAQKQLEEQKRINEQQDLLKKKQLEELKQKKLEEEQRLQEQEKKRLKAELEAKAERDRQKRITDEQERKSQKKYNEEQYKLMNIKQNKIIEQQVIQFDQLNTNNKRQIFPPQQLNILYPGIKSKSPIKRQNNGIIPSQQIQKSNSPVSRLNHGIIPPQQLNFLTEELKSISIQKAPLEIRESFPQKEIFEIQKSPPQPKLIYQDQLPSLPPNLINSKQTPSQIQKFYKDQQQPLSQPNIQKIEPQVEAETLRETLLINNIENKQQEDIWQLVYQKLKAQDLNEAYNIILQQEDDIYLLRLMQLTGSCTSNLSFLTARAIVIRLSQILSSQFTSTLAINLFDECLENDILQELSNQDIQDMLDILYSLAESNNQFVGEQSVSLFYKIESELNQK